MHYVARFGLSLLGIGLGVGCSSTTSPLERGRSPVLNSDTGDGSGEQGEATGDSSHADSATRADGSHPTPSDETTVGKTTVGKTTGETKPVGTTAAGESTAPPPSSVGSTSAEPSSQPADGTTPTNTKAGYWALVRSEDSGQAIVEHWDYDDAGRLVNARVIRVARAVEPYYAVDITLRYDGDHVTAVHDALPEGMVDITYGYQLQEGRVVEYTQATDGEANLTETFEYDDAGRLIGSREVTSGSESVWTLSRRPDGEPGELSLDGRLLCRYSWRTRWLDTTCYTNGEVSQVYEGDVEERLARLTLEGTPAVAYSYDEAGHLTQQTNGTYVHEYKYSSDGKLLESRITGSSELRTYDERGLLREVSWSNGSTTITTVFTYERVAADEVIETETSGDRTVVRTYRRLAHVPTVEPLRPSFWSILRMDQPDVYIAPTDYSNVP